MGWYTRQDRRRTLLEWGAVLICGLLGVVGCARTPAPTLPTPELDRSVSWLHAYDDGAQRLARFGALHETVRLLLIASGAQADWVRHGAVSLPVDSCLRAVSVYEESVRECSLVAIDAASAVMIVSESSTCERWSCLEHSWAFLSDLPGAVPLPPRRASDYGSLRADLSREVAEALWVAGYRGRSDRRVVDNTDPYGDEDERYAAELADFSIASYRSCKLAPDGVELVCRAQAGGVIGLNPHTSQRRAIASLATERQRGALVDPDGPRERVWWTQRGELALTLKMQRHPLCGAEACTLLGLMSWPVSADSAPRFVRID